MMEKTKVLTALKGVRGRKPVDLDALDHLVVRFSQLVAEQPYIKELDINPLLASPDRLLALDARVVLHGPELGKDGLPQLAIRPYPTQYVAPFKTKKGTTVIIRPIRPEDEPLVVEFHGTLSDRTVYMRYLHPMLLSERVAHERLARICHGDYDREITLIVEDEYPDTGEKRILGAGRLSKIHGMAEARFSVLLTDDSQGLGLGTELLRRLIHIAHEESLQRLESTMTEDNEMMQHICKKLGFEIIPSKDEGMVVAQLELN